MKKNSMEDLLNLFPPGKDDLKKDGLEAKKKIINPSQMEIEAVIDLHGLTREEAENQLDVFIKTCVKKGLRKIKIVHGKGLHSKDVAILKEMTKSYLYGNPYVGRFEHPGRNQGGSGATWVILKH